MDPTSRSAVAAALLIVPVAVETLVRSDDLALWGHAVFVTSQLAGWALLLSVCRALVARGPRSLWGPRLVRAGCALQLLFASGYGVTVLIAGEPSAGMFVVFLLAFLSLTVGGLLWARRLRAASPLAARGLAGTAVLGFLAVAVGMDPWHDVFLLASYAAWVAVGMGATRLVPAAELSDALRSAQRRPAPPSPRRS